MTQGTAWLWLATVAHAVPYGQLPPGVTAPQGYSDYRPDPTVSTCAPEWQYCGHQDWSASNAWNYATCCSGLECSTKDYTCQVSTSAGVACASNAAPLEVAAPSGYCQYKQEADNVDEWGLCGHEDWNVATTWTYSTCKSGTKCTDGGSKMWSCMKDYSSGGGGAAEWTQEDIEMMCSCCTNSCGAKFGYVCMASDAQTCAAYGPDYHWCDDQYYNPTKCDQVKEVDQLNWYKGELMEGPKEWPPRVYAPYLDGGLYPILVASNLQKEQNINHFLLAFVVARQDGEGLKCIPTYAANIDARVGPTSYNSTTGGYDYFYDQINLVRKAGGDVSISFGGAMNTELADAPDCVVGDDISKLVEAYEIVIQATKSSHIDFDIEGAAISSLNSQTGWVYRFDAVNQLTAKYPDLKVAFTLPILSSGLTPDGMAFIQLMMQKNVKWDYFNVMTMDYGDSGCDLSHPSNPMGNCEVSAIKTLAQQMYQTAQQTGRALQYGWKSIHDVYPRLGSTPMLGLNDLTNEFYSLDDAEFVYDQVKSDLPIRLWSTWSIFRDHPCTFQYVDTGCSSTGPQPGSNKQAQTRDYEFSQIFNKISTQ